MNSLVRRYVGHEPMLQSIAGVRRARDRYLIYGSVVMAVAAYVGVYYNGEQEKTRRHTSIVKDIERERWRARELGLDRPRDDGFAERYIAQQQQQQQQRRPLP